MPPLEFWLGLGVGVLMGAPVLVAGLLWLSSFPQDEGDRLPHVSRGPTGDPP